ncbi:hypothetical protein A3A93_03355 [Candidatus Roizmanbacteria bacterium RIFCSPLOWO2_01_FULL_38_12]|uniref:Uncharacterized protein n=1 Tax=Candidatus Roizmanbacteria bacterium RIFCSPLOWO2_01_FULL_38_12 TaxID=1802061 RepID=A0A1F7ISP3_9BACT|nr:MAG: hypothetical protein A2861_01235 [Candidatus Roizmanbacteria bacterium RIFCSPHIGHO2_01_FULL_38_15]OGK35808.1 MAG: hypothetical protein A3F59_03640 [Candidatus Roizmanbacteria bacterium RIFCSPHIGHO2_12_FULL_38_13]OGK46382.1 MAG: hypothetical protein A3A93_03355 [Candidatus Roizmanbacteria bacterium RIFCSPLOWO2_01_FULL_38_12]
MTLTEVNYYVRRLFPVIVIVILVIAILFFAGQLLFSYLGSIQPASAPVVTPPPINEVFGKIKPPIIPQAKSSSEYTFVLDTLDGTANIPEASSAAEVFFLPRERPTFGYVPKIGLMAKEAGFNTDGLDYKTADEIATFEDGKRKLSIDITNYNFTFDFVLTTEDINLETPAALTDQQIQSQASDLLRRMNRYPAELGQGKTNIIYLRFNPDNQQITNLESAEGANMVEVDFYRPDLNGFPIVTSTYYNSPNYVLYGFKDNVSLLIRAQVKYFEKSTDKIGLYPVRSGDRAFEDLQSGKGYVVSAGQEAGEIAIKKVFFAYYDPDVYQEYFQPVYVFLGENRFVAYVTALADSSLLQVEN